MSKDKWYIDYLTQLIGLLQMWIDRGYDDLPYIKWQNELKEIRKELKKVI